MGRRLKIEQMTERDVRRFKKDIEGYEKTKKLFLMMAFVALGLMIVFLLVAIMFGVFAGIAGSKMDDYFSYEYFGLYVGLCTTCAGFSSSFFIYMLLMFILRALLFKKKTENRLFYIEEYEIYQKEHAQEQQKEPLVVEPEPLEPEAK